MLNAKFFKNHLEKESCWWNFLARIKIPVDMLRGILTKFKRKSHKFLQYDDGYTVKGDSKYIYNELGWWDCYNIKGNLPQTLEDFSKFTNNKNIVIDWFKKYRLNLIVCVNYLVILEFNP